MNQHGTAKHGGIHRRNQWWLKKFTQLEDIQLVYTAERPFALSNPMMSCKVREIQPRMKYDQKNKAQNIIGNDGFSWILPTSYCPHPVRMSFFGELLHCWLFSTPMLGQLLRSPKSLPRKGLAKARGCPERRRPGETWPGTGRGRIPWQKLGFQGKMSCFWKVTGHSRKLWERMIFQFLADLKLLPRMFGDSRQKY